MAGRTEGSWSILAVLRQLMHDVSMLETPAGAKGLNAFQDHQENSQIGLEEWKEDI